MSDKRIVASQASGAAAGGKTKAAPPAASQPSRGGGSPGPRPGRSDRAISAERRGGLLRRLMAAGDWMVLIGTLCFATATTSSTDVATLFWAVLFSPIWILVIKLHGLYDNDHRRIRHSTFDELPNLVSATVLGTLAIDGLLALSPAGPLSAWSAIVVGVGSTAGIFLVRATLRFAWHSFAGVAVGIVLGPATAANLVGRRISTHPEARLRLVGYLGAAGPEPDPDGLTRLGAPEEIARVARDYGVERVIVAEQEMSDAATEELIEQCKAGHMGLTILPQHHGLLGPGIELNRLAELPVLDFRFSDPSRSTMFLKRCMDIAVSALMLAVAAPLMLVIAVAVVVDSGRPVFFRQKRAGKDGEPFLMVKFRTMGVDAEARLGELVDLDNLDQPAFKIEDDPRVTRIGRHLRRTSLDELPQLFNVLRGTMSLVGPRPEEEAVVALYDERQRIRLAVKPGLTGPMQVYGRGDLTFEERLAMERDYLDNLSIAGDLAILLRTPGAMVRGDGAY